jgi:hypothetical protein
MQAIQWLWHEAHSCCTTAEIVSQVSFMNVSSLNVSFCKSSHVVDTKHAGAMNRDRTFAGYVETEGDDHKDSRTF